MEIKPNLTSLNKIKVITTGVVALIILVNTFPV